MPGWFMLKLVDVEPLRWESLLGRIRMVNLDTSSLWSVQQSAPHIALATLTSCVSFLLVMTQSIKCQCLERGCIQDVLFRRNRRNTMFVLSNSCSAQVLSSSSPLLLHFPTSLFPRTLSQAVWSVPTLALKSPRRNSFSQPLTVYKGQWHVYKKQIIHNLLQDRWMLLTRYQSGAITQVKTTANSSENLI